jgi:hypothetical protein
MKRQGASIIAGSGAVVRHDRLTVVAGGSVIQGSDDLGRGALGMLDTLDAAGDWSFEAVAAALHQLVLDEDPRGVAAVLADDEGEVLLFAFDRASAQGGDVLANGNGRGGWTTQVADGDTIQLRLDNVPFKAAENDIELRAGLVPGAGALLSVVPIPRQSPKPVMAAAPPSPQTYVAPQQAVQEQAPAPPPPMGPSASSALPPNYLPAAPPTESNKVDSSLLPPPPGEWRPGHRPPTPSQTQPHSNPPPPAGPASNLPPPPAPTPAPDDPSEPEAPSGPPAKGSWDN